MHHYSGSQKVHTHGKLTWRFKVMDESQRKLGARNMSQTARYIVPCRQVETKLSPVLPTSNLPREKVAQPVPPVSRPFAEQTDGLLTLAELFLHLAIVGGYVDLPRSFPPLELVQKNLLLRGHCLPRLQLHVICFDNTSLAWRKVLQHSNVFTKIWAPS